MTDHLLHASIESELLNNKTTKKIKAQEHEPRSSRTICHQRHQDATLSGGNERLRRLSGCPITSVFFFGSLVSFFWGSLLSFFLVSLLSFSLFGSNSRGALVGPHPAQLQARYTGCGGRFTPFRLYDSDLFFFLIGVSFRAYSFRIGFIPFKALAWVYSF